MDDTAQEVKPNTWDTYFKDNDTIEQIHKDVQRLCPEFAFFQGPANCPRRKSEPALPRCFAVLWRDHGRSCACALRTRLRGVAAAISLRRVAALSCMGLQPAAKGITPIHKRVHRQTLSSESFGSSRSGVTTVTLKKSQEELENDEQPVVPVGAGEEYHWEVRAHASPSSSSHAQILRGGFFPGFALHCRPD